MIQKVSSLKVPKRKQFIDFIQTENKKNIENFNISLHYSQV